MKNIQMHLGLKNDKFNFRTGDTVKVHAKIVEGDSERIQVFDGVVIARRGSGISETLTVRKISYGVGVERVFPLHSPRIEKIETVKTGKVRRSKIYYLRELSGKSARLAEQASKENGDDSARPAVPALAVPAAAPAVSDTKAGS